MNSGSMMGVYGSLDKRAEEHARTFLESGAITENAIRVISDLYQEVGAEKKYNEDGKFESAYQLSVTPLFEFYFARLLYRLSEEGNYGWKVYLRRQVQGCAPDIRIEKDKRTIAIVEIKIKGGWMRPFFSKDRFEADMRRLEEKKSDFDPTGTIKKVNGQLEKYRDLFSDNGEKPPVFLFLPTFHLVHNKKYKAKYEDYKQYFEANTGLPAEHLVVLSQDLTLDLNKGLEAKNKALLDLTSELEGLLKQISSRATGYPVLP